MKLDFSYLPVGGRRGSEGVEGATRARHATQRFNLPSKACGRKADRDPSPALPCSEDPPPPYTTMVEDCANRCHGQACPSDGDVPESSAVKTPWKFPKGHPVYGECRDWPYGAEQKGPRRPKTECYAVRRPMYNDIVARMGSGLPTVDVFSNSQLHLVDRWWGPGSPIPDSFQVYWGQEPLLWLNPPFSLLGKVVQKLEADKARGILICPHWTSEEWYPKVKKMSTKSYFYKRGTLLFEDAEGSMPGIRWPVWALLVNGADLSQPPDERQWRISQGAARRYRRRNKEIRLC